MVSGSDKEAMVVIGGRSSDGGIAAVIMVVISFLYIYLSFAAEGSINRTDATLQRQSRGIPQAQ